VRQAMTPRCSYFVRTALALAGAGGMVRGARALSGAGDRLGSAVDAELGVDVAQVRPDRVRRTSRIVDRNVACAVRRRG
jgi:hypothetical protein